MELCILFRYNRTILYQLSSFLVVFFVNEVLLKCIIGGVYLIDATPLAVVSQSRSFLQITKKQVVCVYCEI